MCKIAAALKTSGIGIGPRDTGVVLREEPTCPPWRKITKSILGIKYSPELSCMGPSATEADYSNASRSRGTLGGQET